MGISGLHETSRRNKNAQIWDQKCLFWMFWTGIWKQSCHICNQQPQICLFVKFDEKPKCLNLGPETPENTQRFWSWNSKTVFLYLKSTPSNLSTWKIWQKKKKNPRKFGIKNVLFVYFSARIWKMLLSYLKWASSSLAFSKIGPKTLDFWYFWVGIWRLFCYIWNQSPRNCLIAKFGTKNEKPKYGTKNALFGLFWPKIRYFGLFWEVLWKFFSHIWNQHPQICLFAKFHEKNGNAWIWTRNAWFGCFWTAI